MRKMWSDQKDKATLLPVLSPLPHSQARGSALKRVILLLIVLITLCSISAQLSGTQTRANGKGRYKVLSGFGYWPKDQSDLERSDSDQLRECRRLWAQTGSFCNRAGRLKPVDLLWTWENSSDHNMLPDGKNDFLKYSLRSAQQHLGDGFGDIFLLTPDVKASTKPDNDHGTRDSSQGRITASGKDIVFDSNRLVDDGVDFIDAESEKGIAQESKGLDSYSESNKTSYTLLEMEGSYEAFKDELGQVRYGEKPSWLSSNTSVINLLHYWTVACPPLSSRRREGAKNSGWGKFSAYACKMQELPVTTDQHKERIAAGVKMISAPFLKVSQNNIFRKDLSVSDYYTSAFGPVIYFDPAFVQSKGHPINEDLHLSRLEYSNSLLSSRFGLKDRAKTLRTPYIVQPSLVEEAKQMWTQPWEDQDNSDGHREIDVNFVLSHFLIERHREALLWSFIVAKHDINGDDKFDRREIRALLQDLDTDLDYVKQMTEPIKVKHAKRETLTTNNHLEAVNLIDGISPLLRPPGFTSMDGYHGTMWMTKPHGTFSSHWINHDNNVWADDDDSKVSCELPRYCFEPLLSSDPKPSEYFRFVALNAWGCGDCFNVHLLRKSGRKGLKAFLPKSDLRMPCADVDVEQGKDTTLRTDLTETFLSTARDYRKADFSIDLVAKANSMNCQNRIDFVTLLLDRYKYTLAEDYDLVSPTFQDDTDIKTELVKHWYFHSPVFSMTDNTTARTPFDATTLLHAWLDLWFPEKLLSEIIM